MKNYIHVIILFFAALQSQSMFTFSKLSSFNHLYSTKKPFQYVDFDVAMQTLVYPQSILRTAMAFGIEGDNFMEKCRQLYNKNNPDKVTVDETLKIPKIIHQVWIGGTQVPGVFEPFMQSWVDKHLGRGWVYKLWTDADVAQLKLYNQSYYDTSDNVGVKSDILKWEIVYRYGGVYIDTDFECLQPLDPLHYQYDFYTALQPLDTSFAQLGAAIFGAKPGHPILKHCIETIKDSWHRQGAPAKTGPIHFSKSFYLTAGQNNSIDIAFPAYYFYPQGCRETTLSYDRWIAQGSYAIHHWSKSWMPVQYRRNNFQTFKNDAGCKDWDK